MDKTPYAAYADYALRFYFSHPNLDYCKNDVERENWEAARAAIDENHTPREWKLLKAVYQSKGSMYNAIMYVGDTHKVSAGKLWAIVKRARREFAIQRGLIAGDS